MWTVRLGGLPWGWGCEWLAIACRVSVGGGCVGFNLSIKQLKQRLPTAITVVAECLGSYVWNGIEWPGSNLPAHFFPVKFLAVRIRIRSHLRRNMHPIAILFHARLSTQY